jgi:hypothetical protein
VQLKRVSVSAYKTCEDIGKQISSVVTIYVYIMYHFILFHAWRLLPLLLGKWVSGLTQNYLWQTESGHVRFVRSENSPFVKMDVHSKWYQNNRVSSIEFLAYILTIIDIYLHNCIICKTLRYIYIYIWYNIYIIIFIYNISVYGTYIYIHMRVNRKNLTATSL